MFKGGTEKVSEVVGLKTEVGSGTSFASSRMVGNKEESDRPESSEVALSSPGLVSCSDMTPDRNVVFQLDEGRGEPVVIEGSKWFESVKWYSKSEKEKMFCGRANERSRREGTGIASKLKQACCAVGMGNKREKISLEKCCSSPWLCSSGNSLRDT
ncbi:hypothetical protein BDW69DRAFT_156857 [Aspergillus filifer]